MRKTHKLAERRERHKAKQGGFAREPQKKIGHHMAVPKYYRGAKIPT